MKTIKIIAHPVLKIQKDVLTKELKSIRLNKFMKVIFFIIWTFIVLEVSYNFWYSPKAQVNRLIRGMRKIVFNMFKFEKEFGKESNMVEICEEALQNRYNAINQLLDVRHYFDPENDKEFIKESREKAETWRNPNL